MMEIKCPILALELALSSEDEKVDLFHIASQDVLDEQELAFNTISQRAEALANCKKVKRLIYQDDDGDWCTMTKTTITDALTFMEMLPDMPEVGKLRVMIITESSDAPSASTTQAPMATQAETDASSAFRELTATHAQKVLNAIGRHTDLRRVLPKLAGRLLQIVRTSQQPCLMSLEPILQQFEEGSLKAEDVPSAFPACIEAVRQLRMDAALALFVQVRAAADEVAKEVAQEQPPNAVEVHKGITCGGCKHSPIVGKRYKSLKHEDYDLCETCFQATMQDANAWVRVSSDDVGDVMSSFYGAPHQESVVHVGIQCDGCDQFPLTGRRFTRVDIDNYDLCGRCHNKWERWSRPHEKGWRFKEVILSTKTGSTKPSEEKAPPKSHKKASDPKKTGPLVKNKVFQKKCAAKCARANCGFRVHAVQGHGFCCRLCREKGLHGPFCEKQAHEDFHQPLVKKLLNHPDARIRNAVMQELAVVAGEANAQMEGTSAASSEQESVDTLVEPAEPNQVDDAVEQVTKEIEPANELYSKDAAMVQDTDNDWAMAEAAAPVPRSVLTAAVLEVCPPILGIEAQEDQAGRGEVTEELREQLQASCVQIVWRVGRILLPVGLQTGVPVCAKFILKNDGELAWPETTCIVSASGNSYGFQQMALGALQPNEVAEVIMDLNLPSIEEPTAERSSWALMDEATGTVFGPHVLLDVSWQATA